MMHCLAIRTDGAVNTRRGCLVCIAGYSRIGLALLSFWYMPSDPIRASLYYIVSGLLDAVDGYAARFLNQSQPASLSRLQTQKHD